MQKAELVDLGTAPEIHVDGLGRITRNNGIVKYALYSLRETSAGQFERVIVAYIVTSSAVAAAMNEQAREAFSPAAKMLAAIAQPILVG